MKDLNQILKKMGGGSYYTPINIIAEAVNVEAKEVVINPPFRMPKKEHHFKKVLKFGKLRFYITWDFRLKNSQSRDRKTDHSQAIETKRKVWQRSGGCCEKCGKKFEKFNHSQMHHILPWWLFRQYEHDIRNVLLLCNDCHKMIHTNPFLDCRMQEEKAKEFGIDLKDCYKV